MSDRKTYRALSMDEQIALQDERDELLAALKRLKAAERAPRAEWEAALINADEAIAKAEAAK